MWDVEIPLEKPKVWEISLNFERNKKKLKIELIEIHGKMYTVQKFRKRVDCIEESWKKAEEKKNTQNRGKSNSNKRKKLENAFEIYFYS